MPRAAHSQCLLIRGHSALSPALMGCSHFPIQGPTSTESLRELGGHGAESIAILQCAENFSEVLGFTILAWYKITSSITYKLNYLYLKTFE